VLKGQSNSKQLDGLRYELNNKLDDFLISQRKYYDLEAKIEEEQRKVNDLLLDKQRVEQERNLLSKQ
jgi:hypothetical protein